MKLMTTTEAFENLCLQDRIWEKLQIPEMDWEGYCREFKLGRLPVALVFEFLERSGYVVAQERLWRKTK